MPYRIETKRFKELVSKASLSEDGDEFEMARWHLLQDTFPNFENYWKHFVVPFTKRIETGIEDQDDRIRHRNGVSEEIKALGISHYSVFLNLVYAYDHLHNLSLSSFEDFYMRIVAACDLAEEFLTNAYLLILECKGEKCLVLQSLSREDFLLLAGEWYDERYSTLYEHYKYRGKIPPIDLPPSRKNILDEFFLSAEPWSEYKRFGAELRKYRNALVHRSYLMRVSVLVDGVRTPLVPRKEIVQEYKTWSKIEAAAKDRERLKRDFIPMTAQMRSDIERVKILFNGLWSKPLDEMIKLLIQDNNIVLLKKYHLDLE